MNSVTVSKQLRLSRGAALVKSCEESGLRVKEWCHQNGVTKDTYYYWKRKLKDLCLEQMDIPSFVEISGIQSAGTAIVQPAGEAAASVMVHGIRVDIYGSASTDFLRNLMEAARDA